MAKALTVKAIEALKAEDTRREVPDGLIAGLYLVVQPSGARSWAVRYRHLTATRKLTLGSYPAIDLKTARDLASKALVAAASGGDPAGDKRAARQTTGDTVEAVAELFVERYAKANAPRSWVETKRIIDREIVAQWRGRRLGEVTRRDVHHLLDRIVDRGSPIAANRTLAALRRLCAWAVERDIITASPCQSVKPPGVERSRDRVLGDSELAAVWQACEAIGWPFAPIFRLLMLTGQRRDEVAQMRWSEIDLEARIWTMPRERTKNRSEHAVHLSTPAVTILSSLPRIEGAAGYVFSTSGLTAVSGFSKAKSRIDTAIAASEKPLAPWTLHDLRRSFASGCAGLGIALPVIERALNHTSGSFAGIVGVYQRHGFAAERQAAMELWGQHINAITGNGTI